MTYPDYIRRKAIEMRVEMDLTIDEIAQRLAIPRTTIYYWVRDLPLKREPRWNPGPAVAQIKTKYTLLREAAYADGRDEYDELITKPSFRDFVCMYIGEGYKKSRNNVSICNSDPKVVVLGKFWICRFSRNPVGYSLQYHADQDPDELRRTWGVALDIDPGCITIQRKSNSNQLAKRTWRSRLGVLTVRASDTYLRARLQAWMDRVQQEWLDSVKSGA